MNYHSCKDIVSTPLWSLLTIHAVMFTLRGTLHSTLGIYNMPSQHVQYIAVICHPWHTHNLWFIVMTVTEDMGVGYIG